MLEYCYHGHDAEALNQQQYREGPGHTRQDDGGKARGRGRQVNRQHRAARRHALLHQTMRKVPPVTLERAFAGAKDERAAYAVIRTGARRPPKRIEDIHPPKYYHNAKKLSAPSRPHTNP